MQLPVKKSYRISVVGATGAVGAELLGVLQRRSFPVAEMRLLASARSTGTTMEFGGDDLQVEELRDDSFAGVDVAFFSAGGEISRRYAPIAAAAGAVVIDNSSVFRMEPDVPLVIPEINGDDVHDHRGIVANPNCTTGVA